jgi:hypothetical protein
MERNSTKNHAHADAPTQLKIANLASPSAKIPAHAVNASIFTTKFFLNKKTILSVCDKKCTAPESLNAATCQCKLTIIF